MATPTNLETYFLQLINETRAKAGVKALTLDGELLDSSDAHSAWMDQTDTFSHTGANGSSAGERMTTAGYGWQGWGENIAYASGPMTEVTMQKLHDMLVNSPGHYANIVNGQFEEIGIGVKEGTINGYDVVFVTQNFGTPNSAERSEPDDVGIITPLPTEPTPVAEGKTIIGDFGNNRLYGTDGNDILKGLSGHDTLDGKAGTDAMYGGAGDDWFYVDHLGDKAYEEAGGGHDSVVSSVTYSLYGQVVENLRLTGWGNINATGNTLNNWLDGNSGANTLDGGARNDILKGRGGYDVLIGGSGNDAFVFDFAEEAHGDTINDFEHGIDTIELWFIDANENVEGKQAFTFIGKERFHNEAGELHYYHVGGNAFVSADTDGDGAADFAIKVLGSHTFVSSDFVL